MKKFIFHFILPLLLGFAILNYLFNNDSLDTSQSNGSLVLSSQMAGLNIIINEEHVGNTVKDTNQTFKLQENGTGKSANHEITLQKDINDTHEWYFYDRFSFNKYVDVQENPKKYINIFLDKPQQKEYPPINFQIQKRIKPDVLAKHNGLIKELKLQHNMAWHMCIDDKYIYVITTASNDINSIKSREKNEGEFLEIYDIDTYEIKQHIKLGEATKSFSYFQGLAATKDYIYVGTRGGVTEYFNTINKTNIIEKRGTLASGNNRHSVKVKDVKIYGKNLFTIREDGKVGIYELFDDEQYRFLYMINTKLFYPYTYQKLEDKRYGDLFDLVVHKNIAYISSDIGVVFKFDISGKKAKFFGLIDTIYKSDDKYVASDINSMQIYKDRYLLFATNYRGVSMYDTLTKKMIYENKNFYPKEIAYSELFKEEFDATKSTDIYKFLIYHDNIIFTELDPEVVVYSLKKEKIVHKFRPTSDDISDIEIHKDKLFSLSADGKIYVWDMGKISD